LFLQEELFFYQRFYTKAGTLYSRYIEAQKAISRLFITTEAQFKQFVQVINKD
jgi:hypothetical protein